MSSKESSPRARRSPDERRAEIAAAAREIALGRGLEAVTLRAVATQVGVAPALVAHYVASMDDVVARAFADIVSGELDDLRRLLGASPDATMRVRALVETLLDGSREDVTLVWVQAWSLGRHNAPLGEQVRKQMDVWEDFIEALVVAGVNDGSFVAANPRAVAGQILAMIDGLNAHALVTWRAVHERVEVMALGLEAMLGLERGGLDLARGALDLERGDLDRAVNLEESRA